MCASLPSAALATDDWIAPERKTGEGPATVNFVVPPNPDGAGRSGAITVGEQRLPVTQGGCSVSIAGAGALEPNNTGQERRGRIETAPRNRF